MISNKAAVFLSLLCVGIGVSTADAQQVGQTDDFSNETTQGWSDGASSPNPPTLVMSGGPQGVNDAYLETTSSGVTGPGGRQVVFNLSQWTGDYLAAGIEAVSVDVLNTGSSNVSMRLGVAETVSSPTATNRFITTSTQPVFNSGGWQTITFDITESAMTNAGGSLTYAQVLASVAEMRIYVSVPLTWQGVNIESTLGLDNITALGANQDPIADAGLPQFLSDGDDNGSEDVTLDGTLSMDPDGQIVSYDWQESGVSIATGSNPTVTLARGVHEITLIVTDDGGATGESTVTVTVGLFVVADLREVPNIGGTAANEAAILKVDQVSGTSDEVIAVQINDVNNGALINELNYLNPDFGANGITVYPGLAPNGGPGIGLWGSRRSDGLSIVQIKDAASGALIRNVFPLSAAWAVIQVEAVPNVAPNGGYGVAALATNVQSGLMIVQVKNAADNTVIRNVFPLGFGWFPISMDVVPDIGNGVPGIAVLAQRVSDQLTIVQVRNAIDGSLVRNVFPLGFGFTPMEMRVIGDSNGDNVWDIATRMRRNSDNLEVLQVRDTIGNSFIRNHFPLPMPAWVTFLNAIRPIDNNGTSEMSVLSVRMSDGQMLAQVRDVGTATLTNNTFLIGPPWTPGLVYRSFADINGNNVSEIAALVQNSVTRAHLLQIRDAADATVLRNIPIQP